MRLVTIGYGNRSLEAFLALLKRNGIDVVCDVRSNPYSARYTSYNREALHGTLKAMRAKYVFMGDLLGARPSDPGLYVNGRASYEAMARSSSFRSGIERLESGMKAYRITLMCAEKDPIDCHRAILIAPVLRNIGTQVEHIAANGKIEADDELRQRLLVRFGLTQEVLFESKASQDVLREAYQRRGDELAYDIAAAYRSRSAVEAVHDRIH